MSHCLVDDTNISQKHAACNWGGRFCPNVGNIPSNYILSCLTLSLSQYFACV